MPPRPLKPGKGVAMLVYGLPGSGKTRLLGSASSPLIIHPPTDHTDSIPPPATGVKEWVVDDWATMLEVFQWGQQGGFRDHDWVGLDSISLIQGFLLHDVLQDAIIRKPARAIKKKGISIPEFGADKGEYKINMDRLSQWVGDMVGLSKEGMFNFLITAHPFEWWDPVEEQDLWAPWVQGKGMSPKMCGFMNIVAYMHAKEKEGKRTETLLVDPDGFVGKDQFHCFPKLKSGRHGFINPTMSDIDAVIKKHRPERGRRPKRTAKKTTRRRRTRK